ncbi:MAG: hypothetical protein ACFE9S_05760 [Candidatus Hermodarchaeota archaeon]
MIEIEIVENIEIKAQNNLDIAEKEKLICRDSKTTAKQMLKSAKARENLAKNEIDLAKLKQRLAEKSKKLVESKMYVKDILEFSNNNLKNEEDYAIYNFHIAGIKKNNAEVQIRIAQLERQIAEEELKVINKKIHVAKERDLLGKKQFNYAKLLKITAASEKLTSAEEEFKIQQKKLNEAIKSVYKKSIQIREREDNLADLKKELSEILAQREKIRPPSGKFPTNECGYKMIFN